MKKCIALGIALLLVGCSASSNLIQSTTLPTSGRVIDVVLHRSDVKFADCGTLIVMQTYDAKGDLIDSKDARGHALHCDVTVAVISAGATVGAANQIRRGIAAGADMVTNNNSNESSQAQAQAQGQIQESVLKVKDITGHNGGHSGGQKGGNNGKGNGGNDGSPNGKSDEGR